VTPTPATPATQLSCPCKKFLLISKNIKPSKKRKKFVREKKEMRNGRAK
jgi:hypothetical protein